MYSYDDLEYEIFCDFTILTDGAKDQLIIIKTLFKRQKPYM